MYSVTAHTIGGRGVVMLGKFLYRSIFPVLNGRGAARLGRAPWVRDQLAVAALPGGSQVTFPALDAFWSQYFYTGREYEPEVGMALRKLAIEAPATFIDCGANYGFWSARMLSGEFGHHEVIAIEASAATFGVLRQSLGQHARHGAISDRTGTMTFAEDGPHQARGLSDSGGTLVQSMTIDSIPKDRDHVLIKLDVEGAEESAIRGASFTIAQNEVAFLYEDHGNDPECASTCAMWTAGLEVFYLSPTDGSVVQIHGTPEVNLIKQDSGMGYNFIAVRPGGSYARKLTR